MVRMEEPEPDTVEGFQDAEVRVGKPLKLRETVPVKPCSAETVMVSQSHFFRARSVKSLEKRRGKSLPLN